MGTIDDYLAELDPADATMIAHIYDVARATVPEAEQGTCYGMPTLMYRDKGLLAVMRTKKHIGLYPPISGDKAIEKAIARYAGPKGNLQFPLDEPMPFDLIRKIVQFRIKEGVERTAAKGKKK